MKILNYRGQTLIEVIIAIAVGTLIITAILGLATRSTRNANFSRANEQASKLSQQGLEIVRNIRDLNGDVQNGSTIIFSDLYLSDIGGGSEGANGVEYKIVPPGCGPPNQWCLSSNVATKETITNDNQNFTRQVFIADTPTISGGASNCHRPIPPFPSDEGNDLTWVHVKQISVLVTWADPSGYHEAKVSTCITLRN